MDNHSKEILGSVLSTIGTVEAAVGSTPSSVINKDLSHSLRWQGNVLQATGNGLVADGQGTPSLELLGVQIQAIGNLAVIVALESTFQNMTKQKLFVIGNWLQAIGSFIALTDEFEDSTPYGRAENITGGILQGVGSSMQAIGSSYTLNQIEEQHVGEEENLHKETKKDDNLLKEKDGKSSQQIGVIGGWIQSVGAVLSLIGQIKEETQEYELNIDE